MRDALRAAVARRLEDGAWRGPGTRAIARVHEALARRTLARPLALPEGVPVIAVGGATLGGSGKTRVAAACVRALALRGIAPIALVGHAYRASPERARVVSPDDALEEVGDEALALARRFAAELDGRAFVVVAPSRQAAVDHAVARGAQAIVVDGALATRPRPPALAILALDRERPWGAGELAPRGDLRAPRDALVAAAGATVTVDAAPSADDAARLRGVRFGLFTALARPDRLVSGLRRAGLEPVSRIAAPDHGPATAGVLRAFDAAQRTVDVWVATPKCAIHLERLLPPGASGPLHVLDDAVTLPVELQNRIERLCTCVS